MNSKRIFMSVPMSGFQDNTDYVKFRDEVLELVNNIDSNKLCSGVFFAGKETTDGIVHSSKDSFIQDLGEIDNSDIFALIFPKRLVTSALVEIGYAVAKKKKVLIFVKNIDDLPYLLKEFDLAYDDGGLYTYEDFESVENKIISTLI